MWFFLEVLIDMVVGLGQVLLRDLNAPGQMEQTGLYQVPLAMANSVRNSPQNFVPDTANATNSDDSRKYHLDISLNALVTKVRFAQNGTTPTAVGVDFLDSQSLYRADPRSASASPTGSGSVNATREVILSTGALNTPQLLKLSGVGPAAELQKFIIPVIVDLPGVGNNLQDRYESTILVETSTDFVITA